MHGRCQGVTHGRYAPAAARNGDPYPLTHIDVGDPVVSLRMPEVRSPTEDEDGVLGLRSAGNHPVDARGDSSPKDSETWRTVSRSRDGRVPGTGDSILGGVCSD